MRYLGIEVGGTKLQAALGDGAGQIEKQLSVRANPEGGRPRICEQILELARSILSETDSVQAAGVGFGGPVDPSRGIVLTSHQVEGWDAFPLANWLSDSLKVPVLLGNDSDLAGLAEAHFGAGRGKDRVVYMNIGSGIGGAIVIGGRVYTSQGQGASEIGHLRIQSGDRGGPWKTLEELASGWSLARQAQQAALDAPESPLGRSGTPCLTVDNKTDASHQVTTEDLVSAVRQGDRAACEIWSRAVEHLGVAVANVITLLRPQVFVVGGGVSLVGDLLFEPLRREADRQAFAPFRGSYDIVPAALGEDVVLHGALKLACDGCF